MSKLSTVIQKFNDPIQKFSVGTPQSGLAGCSTDSNYGVLKQVNLFIL